MTATERERLLQVMKARFDRHPQRHEAIAWPDVENTIRSSPDGLRVLHAMETTGGEPDVIGLNAQTGRFTFCDCAAESPAGRRSICYDRAGLESRKEHRPADDAVTMAAVLGIEILTEAQYRALQTFGEFDTKTSSWISTPPDVRARGGALFCDRRYGMVFVYHNGAQSFYASRGFRGFVDI